MPKKYRVRNQTRAEFNRYAKRYTRYAYESAGCIPYMAEELFRIRDVEQNVFYKTVTGQERFKFKNAIHREKILNLLNYHPTIYTKDRA